METDNTQDTRFNSTKEVEVGVTEEVEPAEQTEQHHIEAEDPSLSEDFSQESDSNTHEPESVELSVSQLSDSGKLD